MAAPAYHANPPSFDDVFADPEPRRSDAWPDEKKHHSGAGALGLHLMNADFDDDEGDDPVTHRPQQAMPALAAPRPGYAAPIAALNPPPSPNPQDPFNPPHHHPRQPQAARMLHRPPPAPISVPSTPHPLPPTMTPIQPVFARPEKQTTQPQVRFGTPILRSGGEDTIARRGEKGDDFWRRFSMIVKEPSAHKESKWLHETQSGKSRWSRYVWIIGFLLLACIGMAIGLGVYSHLTNKSNVESVPKAVGGSADHSGTLVTSAVASQDAPKSSTPPHVSPTFTVARREPLPEPTPLPLGAPIHVIHLPGLNSHQHRRSRKRGNRTTH